MMIRKGQLLLPEEDCRGHSDPARQSSDDSGRGYWSMPPVDSYSDRYENSQPPRTPTRSSAEEMYNDAVVSDANWKDDCSFWKESRFAITIIIQ